MTSHSGLRWTPGEATTPADSFYTLHHIGYEVFSPPIYLSDLKFNSTFYRELPPFVVLVHLADS